MFLSAWRRRWWRATLAVAVSAPLLIIVFVFWRASQAKQEAAGEIAANSDIPFRLVTVDAPATTAVDLLAASPGFRDIAAYKGMIVVSARAGLFVYDRDGALVRTYRTGIELPSAELGPMSAGIAAASNEPELFIATHGEGVLAFNGTRFRQILPSDPDLRNITNVLVLGSGRVLLGTEHHGLLVFDGRRIASFHSRLKTAHITALAGNDGDLWIGTLAEGIFRFRAGQVESLVTALPDPQVLSISIRDGAAYVGTPMGVAEFRNGQPPRRLADGFFARAVLPAGAILHVGTEDEGFIDVPLESRPSPRLPADSAEPAIPILRMAAIEGQAYALSESAVHQFNPARKQWETILSPGRVLLSDRNVASLALSGGRLWVGYFDRGLDVVDTGLTRSEHFEDDTLFCVNRIVPDAAHGRTAVATANGLVFFDAAEKPRQVMGKKDGLLSEHVTDVAFREDGMVVATPAGLSFASRNGVRSLYVFHGLVNNHVYTVATGGSETLAGTLGGVSVLNDDTVRVNYTTANSHLKHNWITALVRFGDDWMAGTYGAGVLRLDRSGEWHSFPDLKDGFVVNPNAMIAAGNCVYAGSLDRGLFIFDRAYGRWTRTTKGLPSKNVTALAAADGYIYVGTDNGLVRIAEGALR